MSTGGGGSYSATDSLEVKRDGSGKAPRCDIMRTAERRQKIVQHVRVGQVDHLEPRAPFVMVAMEQVVVSDRDIEQVRD